MSSPVTEARLELAAALTAAGLPAFAAAPSTAPVPSCIVNPGSPYLEVVNLGQHPTYRVGLVVSISAPAFSTAAALETLEALVDRVIEALPNGIAASSVSSPRLEFLGEGQGSVYIAEVTLSALVKKE